MMPRLQRTLLSVVTSKRFWIVWAGVFAALIGIASGLAQLFSEVKLSATKASVLIIVSSIIGAIYALLTTSPVHLPVDDIVPSTVTSHPVMSLEVTTERALQLQANRLAASSYTRVAPLSSDRYEQWLMINPNVLACLLNNNRQVVGYFDVFPLESSFFKLFIDGLCVEHDIRREHILGPSLARNAKQLYLGGIAVAGPNTMKGKRYASVIIWGLFKYLQHYYCVPCDLELYAEAASKEGEELLKRFGFQLTSTAKQRKSSCALYSVLCTDEVVNKALSSIPDWSGACRLIWA